jgi:hypothetical protein
MNLGNILRSAQRSGMTFITSSGGDLSWEALSMTIGSLTVQPNTPGSNGQFSVSYGAWGVGLSLPVRELPHMNSGFDQSESAMYSIGAIFSLVNRRLQRSDFQGGCVVLSGGLALVTGVSGGIFFFGAPPALTAATAATEQSISTAVLGPAYLPAAIMGAIANHFAEEAFWRSFKGFAAVIGVNRGLTLPGISLMRGMML